ncbi:hypothetical protein [Streptomyces marianii]|uniref:Tetratricopeptide repeat protein n=1 Tax=Streptomyces marianii TaxID=1817406 RepID=A0A5R9E8D6_9ACTN|nr:hypothetical protein [Streptomyces marianii]TLQ46360.1 hypothetical protein FEF34_28260 [Streptomyces marianii]
MSLLDELMTSGLVDRADDDRHQMHDLVRLHAWERAVEEEAESEEAALTERVVTHYLSLTALADQALHPGRMRVADSSALMQYWRNPFADGVAALEWMDTERANILAVLEAALRFELHSPAWQLAEACMSLFWHRAYPQDWRKAAALGAEAASAAGAPAAEARLRSLLAYPLLDLGEHEQAREELHKAAACAEAAGHPVLKAGVQEVVGRYAERTAPQTAAAAYERCVSLYEDAGHARGAALARYHLGRCQSTLGAHAQALSTLRMAHAELTALDDERAAARTLTAIGVVHDHLGDPVLALHALRDAACALREQGASYHEAQTLELLADIAERTGGPERDRVRDWLIRAAEIHQAAHSPAEVRLRERIQQLEQSAR